jgi:hypothetical protein
MGQAFNPANNNSNSRRNSSNPIYAGPPADYDYDNRPRSRSRGESRRRHHHHHHHNNNSQYLDRPQVQRKKSSGVSTFLGAGGGAIVGDLIFPGLGTLGGAILGGMGGHEYGKKRAHSHPNKFRERSYSNGGSGGGGAGGYYNEDDYQRGRKY